jgi:hypothetical protein
MKALMRDLTRLPPVVIAPTPGGMYIRSEEPPIQAARNQLVERLDEAPIGSVVPLSFEHVEVSASCIASLLGSALRAIAERHLEGKFVVGWDPRNRNEWDADAGLKKESEALGRKLVAVWEASEENPVLVGPVDEQVRVTYQFVCTRAARHDHGTTARDLAERYRLSIQAASNRLAKASGLGLLYAADRESVPGGGTQYVYVPVK